jgi:hypothetical protein
MPSFDLYEYVGYIVPGSVLLLCLMALCPWIRKQFDGGASAAKNGGTSAAKSEGTSAANIGTFLIVTFLLGHFLHVVAHDIEKRFRLSCEAGLYGQNVVVTDPTNQDLLSETEREDLRKKVSAQFKVDMKQLTLSKTQDFTTWCNTLVRIEDAVQHDKRGAPLGTFIKDYGLYLGLTTAFGLTFLLCIPLLLLFLAGVVLRKPIVGVPLVQILIVFGIAGIGGSLAFIRLVYFGRLFSRELFLSFLASPNLCYSAFE